LPQENKTFLSRLLAIYLFIAIKEKHLLIPTMGITSKGSWKINGI
jgi:hypothetical protein